MKDLILLRIEQVKCSKPGKLIACLIDDVQTSNLVNHAYAMAYVTLFSLVPSLAAVFGVLYLFVPFFGKNSEIINHVKDFILKHLATGSGQEVVNQIDIFLQNTDFGQIGASGFAGMVLTLALLLRQIELALNRIFEVSNSRPIFTRFIYFWTILTLGTFLCALGLGTLAGSHFTEPYLSASFSFKVFRELIYNLSLVGFFICLYRVVPNKNIPWRSAFIGGSIAALFFAQSLRFFSFYISYFTKFTAIYGALSALPTFLFWLYVIWFITLFGAVITKRSMDGIATSSDSISRSHSDIEQLLTPLWILYFIHLNFEKGSGLGLSDQDIANQSGISNVQCEFAIHTLIQKKLIIQHHIETNTIPEVRTFFPALPIQKVTFDKLKLQLLGDRETWIPPNHINDQMERERFSQMAQALLDGKTISLSNFL